MALLIIGGETMPSPSDMDFGIYDISKAERNAKGKMIIERIATKKKIGISYNFITRGNLQTILNAVKPAYFNVTYIDPLTNTTVTGSFYCGDRSLGYVDYLNNVPRYKELKFDLIER
jgi:hypothetical protein